MAENGWIIREHYKQRGQPEVSELPNKNERTTPGIPPHLLKKEKQNQKQKRSETHHPATTEINTDTQSSAIGGQSHPSGPIFHPAIEQLRNARQFLTRNDPTSIAHGEARADPLTGHALRSLGVEQYNNSKAHGDTIEKDGPSVGSYQVSLISGHGDQGLVHEMWTGDDDSEHEEWHRDYTEFAAFILNWLKGHPDEFPPALLTEAAVDDSHVHGIDTETGKLVTAVSQPDTMPPIDVQANHQEMKDLFVHLNETSWAYIHGYVRQQARKDIKGLAARAEARQAPRQFAGPAVQKPTPLGRHVGTACHLRPATKDDLQGVLKLYNREVRDGIQVADTMPVTESNLAAILGVCKGMNVPFIVVANGTVVESAARKAATRSMPASVFKDYPQLLDLSKDEILGYAFVYFDNRGLSGSPVTNVNNSAGKLFIGVHPDSRRKGLGMALMDKILSCCCTRWHAGDYYTFANPDNDYLYGSSTLNSCTLMRLFIDILYKNQDDTEMGAPTQHGRGWIEKYLTKTFPFEQLFKIDHHRYHKTDATGFWLDKITYQVVCRRPEEAFEN